MRRRKVTFVTQPLSAKAEHGQTKATDKRRQKRGNRIKRPVAHPILIDFIPPTRHGVQDMTRSVKGYADDPSHRLNKLAVPRYTEMEAHGGNSVAGYC